MKMRAQTSALSLGAVMGLRPTQKNESQTIVTPGQAGCQLSQLNSQFRGLSPEVSMPRGGDDATIKGTKRRISVCLLLAILVAMLIAASTPATTLVRMSLDQLAEASTEIIRGHVVSQQTLWNPQHTRIYTYTTLALDQTYKGNPPSFPVVQQPGGTIGKVRVFVAGTVQFHAQASYMLFLERSGADPSKFLLVGMMQGAYRIYRDAETQEERLILQFGSLSRGTPASGAGSIIAGQAVPARQFQRDVLASLSSPLSIPRGTAIAVAIKSARSAGAGRMDVRGRTTSDLFPNSGLVIPAGSAVSGKAERIGNSWRISWTEVSIGGKEVLLSARSTEPAVAPLPGRVLVVNVR
jgi:hypothetical protein